jgi:transposase
MAAGLDELGLAELVTSIDGLSPVGAAVILAETGDLHRFTSARAVVKHAGLAPPRAHVRHLRRKSAAVRSRPPSPANSSLARRVGMPAEQPRVRRSLPPPDQPGHQPAQADQAQTVIAAAILRQLHAVVTHEQACGPHIAAHGLPKRSAMIAA